MLVAMELATIVSDAFWKCTPDWLLLLVVVSKPSKTLNTLHDFQLSQTKDWHRETIVPISVIAAPNRRSCVV